MNDQDPYDPTAALVESFRASDEPIQFDEPLSMDDPCDSWIERQIDVELWAVVLFVAAICVAAGAALLGGAYAYWQWAR